MNNTTNQSELLMKGFERQEEISETDKAFVKLIKLLNEKKVPPKLKEKVIGYYFEFRKNPETFTFERRKELNELHRNYKNK